MSTDVYGLPDGLPADHGLHPEISIAAIKFARRYLVQPNGERAGKPFLYTNLQARLVLWWYATDDRGVFVYRRAAFRAAKGHGKVSISSTLALFELCGTCRFDGWNADGSMRLKRQEMPWVALGANTEGQTAIVFSMLCAMIPVGCRLRVECDLDVQRTQLRSPLLNAKLDCLSSSAGATEGFPYTAAFMDEQEHAFKSNGGTELNRVVNRNLTKTNGRMLSTENAFSLGKGSVAEGTYDTWVAQQTGKLPFKDVLYVSPMAPADVDIEDVEDLKRGLRAAYTDAPWILDHLDRVVAEFYDPETPENDARRYYLNQLVSGDSAWMDPTEWSKLANKDLKLTNGDAIVMFFDGSRLESNDPTRDSTALVACRLSDGYVQLLGMAEYGDGQVTADVDLWVKEAFETYDVVAFFCDVREFESQVLTTWPEEYADKVQVWANPNGKIPAPFNWDMRSKGPEFTKATEKAYSDIMRGEFLHDGSLVLATHVGSAARRPNRYGNGIGKESPNSPRKIDGAVCVIGARHAREIVLADKDYQRRARRASRGPVNVTVW